MRSAAKAPSAEEAVRLAVEHHPDVALLDIHMPGNGIQAARDIIRKAPEVVVVMLTQSAEDDDLFDSLRAGASGYLLKDTDPLDAGREAARRPRRGGRHASPARRADHG